MHKILIIKLGAMGDVLRTTPLLTAYKKLYPGVQITWVVFRQGAQVLEKNPLIDRLWVWDDRTLEDLKTEEFDISLNLDKEPEALDAALNSVAREKKGFGWGRERKGVVSLNPASDYAVRLGLDDELKFRTNRKTYQEISFEQAELVYGREGYIFEITDQERKNASDEFLKRGLDPADLREGVGINTGSGDRFCGKRLPEGHIAELAKRIHKNLKRPVFLLGGPEEHELNRRIEKEARPYAVNAGTDYTIRQFAALVSQLKIVVSGDTIAMHIAIAMGVPALVYFGSTSAQEIELYGRGKKILAGMECAPCYKKVCPKDDLCMKEISMDELYRETKELVGGSIYIS